MSAPSMNINDACWVALAGATAWLNEPQLTDFAHEVVTVHTWEQASAFLQRLEATRP